MSHPNFQTSYRSSKMFENSDDSSFVSNWQSNEGKDVTCVRDLPLVSCEELIVNVVGGCDDKKRSDE